MTLKAKRKLHQAGKSGNWRFKGLLLAALDHDVTPEDVANAWPSPGNPSDYRFLRQVTGETQNKRQTVGVQNKVRNDTGCCMITLRMQAIHQSISQVTQQLN
ncbi:hypothetical protein OSG_eHP42_00020 [environmental Halophage eHP-42]|nr:hypothetical protein OSG_eHP42_00020 [environmental Halophage eHP-42]